MLPGLGTFRPAIFASIELAEGETVSDEPRLAQVAEREYRSGVSSRARFRTVSSSTSSRGAKAEIVVERVERLHHPRVVVHLTLMCALRAQRHSRNVALYCAYRSGRFRARG